jgi:hypothetical protein
VAIILGGGEALRMRSVTRFITGHDGMPKRFLSDDGRVDIMIRGGDDTTTVALEYRTPRNTP